MQLRGQGATEYLVLLAVVLIVALVSVALLGFFPGMASDAQITQSKAYWSSASPISIVEVGARYLYDGGGGGVNHTVIYLRIRNNGPYRISITKIYANGAELSRVATDSWGPDLSLSGRAVLSPGEEFYFGDYTNYFPGLPDRGGGRRNFFFFCMDTCWDTGTYAFPSSSAKSFCSRTAPYGNLVVNGFGFEYIAYIDNQPITKKQIGTKPLVVECMSNYN